MKIDLKESTTLELARALGLEDRLRAIWADFLIERAAAFQAAKTARTDGAREAIACALAAEFDERAAAELQRLRDRLAGINAAEIHPPPPRRQ